MADTQTLSLLDGGPLELPPSVWHRLGKSFEEFATRDAVITMHQDPKHLSTLVSSSGHAKYLTWTYDELLTGAIALTASLQAAGIKTGATVISLLPNGADYCLVRLAGVLGKTNYAALDVGALSEARKLELQNFLTLLKPDVVVVADAAAAASVDAAIIASGHDIAVKLDAHWDRNTEVPVGWIDLDHVNHGKVVDQKTRNAILADALVDDHERTAITLFTSGTSVGRPKGCPRSVRNMLYTLDCVPNHYTDGTIARWLLDSANFRAICSVVSTGIWLNGGCLICSGPAPSPANALKAMEELKVTDAVLVPALVKLVVAHPDFTTAKVSSVKTVGCGGDVVTRSTLETIDKAFPNARGVNVHGMSEGGNLFDWSLIYGQRRYFGEVASFGKLMPGAMLKVVDEKGQIVPRGTPGELHINSPGTIPHYLEGVAPDTFYDQDGARWFKTGDTSIIDQDGYTYIVGRSKDIIKRSGVPITPLALETCLAAYCGAEAVVLGVDHQVYGAVPYAILSHLGDKTIDQLKARVVEMMGPDYAIQDVVTLQQLEFSTWPLNATDKVNKVELKATLLRYLAAQ